MMDRFSAAIWGGAILLISLSTITDVKLISYPMVVVAAASILYIALENGEWEATTFGYKPLLILCLLSFITIGSIVYSSSSGLPDYTYFLIAISASLITLLILTERVYLSIANIIIFSALTRAIFWFSFPEYGSDRFHYSIVGYIISSGDLVPQQISYYHFFPWSHVFGAVGTLIVGSNAKAGFWLTVGLIEALSLIGIFLLARYLHLSKTESLFAMLAVSIAAAHISRGGEIFAQSLLTAILPLFFYILASDSGHRKAAIGIVLALTAAIIHNLGALLIMGVGGLLLVMKIYEVESLKETKSLAYITLLGMVFGTYYYGLSDYLPYHVNRALGLVLVLQSRFGGQFSGGNGTATIPTVTLLGEALPGLLMWAVPVLTILFYITFFGIYAIQDKSLPNYWEMTAIIMFGVFSVILVIGGGISIDRLLPAVTVLIAPICGKVLYRIGTHGPTPLIISVIFIITLTNVISPGVAIPERSDNSVRPAATESTLQAADFAMASTENTVSGTYISRYLYWKQVRQGENPEKIIGVPLEDSPNDYINKSTRYPTLYRTYYQKVHSIPKLSGHKVYSTGKSALLLPVEESE